MGLTHFPHGVSSFGQPLYGGNAPVMGKQYHVRKTDDTNYDSWYDNIQGQHSDGTDVVHTTIESALAVAEDFDTIWVYPGQWKPTGTLAITQDSLRLLAVQTGPNKAFTRTEIRQWGNVACNIITIEGAHNVEIAGFRLTPYGGTTYHALVVGGTAETYGAYVHDNYFYAAIQTGNMVQCGTYGGYNADSIAFINNEFYKGGTAGDQSNNAACRMLQANKFLFMGNTISTVGSGQYWMYCSDAVMQGKILNNTFWGAESGNKGIYVGTAGAGDYCIDGNHFVNYAADSCISDPDDTCCGLNYYNETVEVSH